MAQPRPLEDGMHGITREHTVWCSGVYCSQWETFSENTVKATVDAAKKAGWVKRNGYWFCPIVCWEPKKVREDK